MAELEPVPPGDGEAASPFASAEQAICLFAFVAHGASIGPLDEAPEPRLRLHPVGAVAALVGVAPLAEFCGPAAAQRFLSTELGAREIRILEIAPGDHGSGRWLVEAEILVPNLKVKMLGLPLTQEILEREYYALELEGDLTTRSYEHLGEDAA